ncbi:MAG: NADH-quinone oxidoreductase subunit M [Tunicatimonas sp.]|uniref:complex I subunit 4 family protein n=1 Tax=Tunicatimonas sp. TaxID=1940096 RepID=UPI003C7251EA
MANHLLSLLLFTPLAVAVVLLIIPSSQRLIHRIGIIVATGLQLTIAIAIYFQFAPNKSTSLTNNAYYNLQLIERFDWISLNLGNLGHLSIDYFVAVDGVSLPLVILAALILLIAAISSWTIKQHVKGYALLFLLLSSSVVGCFIALDFFLFYLFFEFMLLPMYFLIGIWGGERREYASIKFFLYTLTGSIFILIAMIGLYLSVIDPVATGEMSGLIGNHPSAVEIDYVQDQLRDGKIAGQDLVRTFDMVAMTDTRNYLPNSTLAVEGAQWGNFPLRWLAFWALLLGFVIKLPSVPLHTWLPDAHVEAPTAISVVLAGLLLKIGGYGIFRTAYSMFPEAALQFAWWIGFLGVISILFAAFNALAMRDLKKMIAYSSVSHMGFVLLGFASLTSEGVSGGLYQMFSHGLISPLLFLLAGVLYDRTHNRMIAHYGGLTQKMPYFTVLVIVGFFASLGLPGFSGFIAEVLTLLGAFNSATVNKLLPRWMAVFAALGLILSAGYYLWTLQRMFFGKYYVREESWNEKLVDLSWREYVMLVPLAVATLVFGIAPSLFLDVVGESVRHWTEYMNGQGVLYLEQMMNR